MKNTFSKFLGEMSPQARNAARVALFILAAGVLTIGVSISRFLNGSGNVPLLIIAIAATITNLVSLWFCRRGQSTVGVSLSLASIWSLFVMSTFANAGTGLALGIIGILVSILAGADTMPPKATRRVMIVSTIMGVIVLMLDLYGSTSRPQTTTLRPILIIGAMLLVGNGFFVIRQFRDFSLRTKLISAFLIVTIVPLAIVSYVNNRSTTQALVQAADVKILGAAQVTADQVDAFIENTLTETRTKAQDPVIINYLLLPASQRAGSAEETQLSKLLAAYANENPIYVNSIGVIDSNGLSLADTSSTEVGVSKADRIYFQQAVKTGAPYSSEVIFSATTAKPSLYFTAPVRNPASGNIIGVFRIRYTADVLQSIVSKNAGLAGAESLPVLLDENHIRLAHGVLPELDFKTIVPLSADALAKLQADNSLPPGTADQLSTNLPELEDGLKNVDKKPFFIAELHEAGQGTEETTAVKLKTHSWILVFGQTNTVFLSPIQVQARNSLVIAVVLAMAVAVLGLFVAQTLTSPIVRLTVVASEIAGGNLAAQARVESSDEIGTLATTFNSMSAQLKNTLDGLEQTVADRTKELEAAQEIMSKRAAELQSVAEISTKASVATNERDMLHNLVELTKSSFNLYHTHVYLLDDDKSKLVLTAGAGEVGSQMVSEKRSIPFDHPNSLVARAARTGQGAISNDVTKEPDFLPNPLLPNTSSEMSIPIIVGDTMLGVFDVQADQFNRFTDEDVAIMTTLARQIAVSLQNIRSYADVQARAEREALIASIGQKIQGAATVESVLQITARELGRAVGSKQTRVLLKDYASAETTEK